MKYMLLVCGDDTADASGMAPVEPWVEDLGDRGVRLHGHRLAPPAEAVTVRMRGGEVLRTDGPFAETKEYVAGYDILECASLEEAVEAAARHPVAALGAMEVRPFWPMAGEEEAETRIRRLDSELTEAARDRDVDRALACYAPDTSVVLPDSGPEPLDREALRKAQQGAYADLLGPVRREVLSFRLRVDESVAFAHALVRIDADRADGTARTLTLHVSTGYRAVADRWLIAHEHVSAAGDGLS